VSNKLVKSVGSMRPPAAGRGRRKGELNRTTVAVKEALTMAFEGAGGVEALTSWARSNPSEFYRLYAKLLPREINVDANTVVRRALLELAEADGDDS
jgi:hypothetical protein